MNSFSEFDGIIPALKTAFTFKVKEKFNSFDNIEQIQEEKIEEHEQNRDIIKEDLLLDDDEENLDVGLRRSPTNTASRRPPLH